MVPTEDLAWEAAPVENVMTPEHERARRLCDLIHRGKETKA